MKKKKRLWQALALPLVFCSLLLEFSVNEICMAASSYTNAKEFFETTGYEDGKHIEVTDGIIYFATQAKLSSSSSNLKYVTLGFDVTLTGNGKSVSFAVKRGGTLAEVPGSSRKENGYEYLLYQISTEDLYRLAKGMGSTNADTVLSASTIMVRMDAIMTTKKNGVNNGSISENGSGGLYETAPVYHLNNSSHLKEMKDIFSGHTFDSYKEIEDKLANYQLSIMYNIGEGATVGNGYSSGSFTSGGTTLSNMLYSSGSVVTEKYRVLEYLSLKNPSEIGLSKTGYHLVSDKEWIKSNGTSFSISTTYMPKDIVAEVGYQNKGVVLYANWQPNEYTIIYNPDGGNGTVAASKMFYDTPGNLRTNTFTKTGYYLPKGAEWNTKADGTGTSYASGASVKNLTEINGGEVILYANWKPCVYEITTVQQNGSGGTSSFFEKYATGFYSNSGCTSALSKITPSTRMGYYFKGYRFTLLGDSDLIVDENGVIQVLNDYFANNAEIYARWEAKQYAVTFDKQGGSYGTDEVVATYDQVFPTADAPVKNGYSFMGYYTKANGQGSCIYNESMISDTIYKYTDDVTLYAYWVDNILPEVSLNVSIAEWTNQTVTLTADAWDFGSGLKSIQLYQISDDGSFILVDEATDLNGEKTKAISFANMTEGIIRYKAVATDMNENITESYNVVYYDITNPSGETIAADIKGTTFYLDINLTDINVED